MTRTRRTMETMDNNCVLPPINTWTDVLAIDALAGMHEKKDANRLAMPWNKLLVLFFQCGVN